MAGPEVLAVWGDAVSLIIALDPGPEQTAVCSYDGNGILMASMHPNEAVLTLMRTHAWGRAQGIEGTPQRLAVEMVASYGMPVGREVFETVLWIGRFLEAWGGPYRLVYRLECKLHLCHDSRAKDANIRQALVDRFGGKGTKKAPGRLYGFSGSDMYSALAVALTAAETDGEWTLPPGRPAGEKQDG